VGIDAAGRVWPGLFSGWSPEELSILETRIKYEGYIRKEAERAQALAGFDAEPIPDDVEYREVAGLSREVVEKCSRRRPETLGAAARIPGMTPAALAILAARVRKIPRSVRSTSGDSRP